jgi:hypothetical protein
LALPLLQQVKAHFYAVQGKILLKQEDGGQWGFVVHPADEVDRSQTFFDSVTYLSFPVCDDALDRMPVSLIAGS